MVFFTLDLFKLLDDVFFTRPSLGCVHLIILFFQVYSNSQTSYPSQGRVHQQVTVVGQPIVQGQFDAGARFGAGGATIPVSKKLQRTHKIKMTFLKLSFLDMFFHNCNTNR